MKCPNCGLICPSEAERCDCGYDFASQRLRESYLPSGPPPPDPEVLSRIYSLLGVDIVAIVGAVAAQIAFPGSYAPLSRNLAYLVHLGAGAVNALLLRRVLVAAGRPWVATTVAYAATLLLCAPVEWVILVSAIREVKRAAAHVKVAELVGRT
jgi:hypothetical protein